MVSKTLRAGSEDRWYRRVISTGDGEVTPWNEGYEIENAASDVQYTTHMWTVCKHGYVRYAGACTYSRKE